MIDQSALESWHNRIEVADAMLERDLQRDYSGTLLAKISESVASELELRQEDEGWRQLGAQGRNIMTAGARDWLTTMSRTFYLLNPLINRGVNVHSYYVWGQGVKVSSSNTTVSDWLAKWLKANRKNFWTHQQRTMMEVELQVTGNLFLMLPKKGRRVMVQPKPISQFSAIFSDPDEESQPWFYRREWTRRVLRPDGSIATETRKAWYPDFRLTSADLPSGLSGLQQIDNVDIEWGVPIKHIKVGGFMDTPWGIPETLQALDWAKAHTAFLEDWASITRALQRFAWRLAVKGSGSVEKAKAKLGTTIDPQQGVGEDNPPPVAGSYFIHGDGAKLEAIPKSGANVAMNDRRGLLLMVAAAMGMPETFFGDVSTGNLATAKTLDRPTELKFRDRQQLWSDEMRELVVYAALAEGINTTSDQVQPNRTVELGPEQQQEAVDLEDIIDCTFPPILQHDITETINAAISAMTLDGKPLMDGIDQEMAIKIMMDILGERQISEELLQESSRQELVSLLAEAVQNIKLRENVKGATK